MDVVNADVQDLGSICRIAVSVEEQFDQERSGDHKRDDAQCRKDRIEDDLKAERVADALGIALAVILRSKDTHTGGRAEDEKIEHEDQLVGDSHAGDRVRSQITDHEIVQKVDEIRDAVLDHHRDGDHEKLLILIFIFFQCHEFCLFLCLYIYFLIRPVKADRNCRAFENCSRLGAFRQ